jgi:hypothetical protein
MSKKQKTSADVKQPLTSDFYSTSEDLVENVTVTPMISEELSKLARCFAKKHPNNRVKMWREYQQSQVRDEIPSPTPEEEGDGRDPESRAQEYADLGPLGRVIHYPLTPVPQEIVVTLDQAFTTWIHDLPQQGVESAASFQFLPDAELPAFETTRLALEPRLGTEMKPPEIDLLLKPRGFTPFPTQIKHPTCTLRSYKSQRFYVFLASTPDGCLLNYFVHANT